MDKLKNLTEREKEICEKLITGATNKEIAIKLDLSEHTIKANFEHMFEKLGVKNRLQLAIKYVKRINP